MTAVVTGATGFIGGRLAQTLLDRGDRIRALVRDPERAVELRDRGAELVRGDLTQPATLRDALEGADRVYHCAGLVGDWLKRDEIRRVNVEGTRSLLDACAAAGVARVLYLSSLAVLGTRHHHGTAESAPYEKTGDAYSDAKIESEQVARSFAERGAVETVILRPGFVYGPGDRQFLPRLVASLEEGKFVFVGDGTKLLNLIYVDDFVQAVLLAAANEEAAGQVYNLTDGTQTSLREFVTFICEHEGIQPPTRSIPPILGWSITYALESLARVRRAEAAPRLTRGRMKFLYYNQFFSIDRARRELGFAPRFTYREGLPIALAWVRKTGALGDYGDRTLDPVEVS
jgi:nucleoside-diphosphate-sugar epimerase